MGTEKAYPAASMAGRLVLFACVLLLLLAAMIFLGTTLDPESTPLSHVYFAGSSLIVNITAAALWLSILRADARLKQVQPFLRVFPFLRQTDAKLYIVLATVPSVTGQKTTGMGEARALAMLLETLTMIGFPMERVCVHYDRHFSESEAEEVVENENSILLGGPNFNQLSRLVLERAFPRMPFVFFGFHEEVPEADLDEVTEEKARLGKLYTGAIVQNSIRHELVTYPLPTGVTDDTGVTRDCALILRTRNENGTCSTVLAGGMSAGVWLAAKALTDHREIASWSKGLGQSELRGEYEIVVESAVEKVLSSYRDRLTYRGIAGLSSSKRGVASA